MFAPHLKTLRGIGQRCDDDYDTEPCPRGPSLASQLLIAAIGGAAGSLVEQLGTAWREERQRMHAERNPALYDIDAPSDDVATTAEEAASDDE